MRGVCYFRNLALGINSKTTANSIVSKLHFEICRLYNQSVYPANDVMEAIRVVSLDSKRDKNANYSDALEAADQNKKNIYS